MKKPLGPLGTAKHNLRRALDFERRRLTDAEWRKFVEWMHDYLERRIIEDQGLTQK